MKKTFLFLSLCALIFSACDDRATAKSTTLGSAYELVVVCDPAKWEGKVGDTLRSFLAQSVPMISRIEPYFDILRVVPSSYNKLILKQRNHLIVLSGDKFERPDLTIQNDVHAIGQLVVMVTAPDNASLADYLGQRADEITNIFLKAERERRVKSITRNPARAINEEVKNRFYFDISIPQEYKIRNQEQSDFMWVSNETHVSQGIIIYSYPSNTESDFSLDSLLSKRDYFTRHIPGPSDSSYMITADVMPLIDVMDIGGRQWVRLSGYWDVHGDFMGGPMRNYTTYDRVRNRMVSIDFYVYSPNIKQRNFLWDTENIIYSVKFPSDGQ